MNHPFSLNNEVLPFFNTSEFKTKFLENNALYNEIINVVSENRNNINKNSNYAKLVSNNTPRNNQKLSQVKNVLLKNIKSKDLTYILSLISYFLFFHKKNHNKNINHIKKYKNIVKEIREIFDTKHNINNINEKENELSTILDTITPLLRKSINANPNKLFQNEGVKVYKSHNNRFIYKDKIPGRDFDSFISLYKEVLIQYILYKYSDETHKEYIPRIYDIYRRKSGSLYKSHNYVRIKMEYINGMTFDKFMNALYRHGVRYRNISYFVKFYMIKVLENMSYFYNTFGLIHHGLKANNIMIIGNVRDIDRGYFDEFDIKLIDFGKSICKYNYHQSNENYLLSLCGESIDITTIDKFVTYDDISNEFNDVFYFIYSIVYVLQDDADFILNHHLKPLFEFSMTINGTTYRIRENEIFKMSLIPVTYNTLKGYIIALLYNKYKARLNLETILNHFEIPYREYIKRFTYTNMIQFLRSIERL